jgi:hypothetical protein
MTLSIETLGDSTSKISIRQLQHGPRPPFSSMSIEVAPGVQSPAFPADRLMEGDYEELDAPALPNAWWCAGIRAPRGNKNALQHGLYTRGAIEERRQLRALMRQSRMLIQDIE